MKLGEIAHFVNGSILGDPGVEIRRASGVEDAAEGEITVAASDKYLKRLRDCRASCVILKQPVENLPMAQLIVANPLYAFARVMEVLHPARKFEPGISDMAVVAQSASIGKDATILPLAYISEGASVGEASVVYPGVFIGEGSKIGRQCTIHPNVTIREGVRIGDRVTVHSGTVIGSDGFGYVLEAGEHHKIPQVGGVLIEDDVEIGSNVSIDRATTGDTIVGRGTKIDNLVQIAHNVKIGPKAIIVAQVGIAGSSELGSFVTLGGQVGVADHVTVDPGTMVGAQSGLMGHVKKGVYTGTPALPHRDWLRSSAIFARLPEMSKKIRELEERLNNIEKGVRK